MHRLALYLYLLLHWVSFNDPCCSASIHVLIYRQTNPLPKPPRANEYRGGEYVAGGEYVGLLTNDR